MRINPRTIYTTGLILISVPIVVELVFGISMFALQRSYQSKLHQERESVEVIFHANDMWVNCSHLMYLQGYFHFFGGPQPPLEEKMASLENGYRSLQKLVADHPSQAESVDKIWSYTNLALKLGQQMQSISSANLTASDKMAALHANLLTIGRAEHYVLLMANEIRNFRPPNFLHSSAVIPEVESSTAMVNRVVLGSLAASSLVSLLLFVYFIRSISKDVNILIDNTERFKQGKELQQRAAGTEELAEVDAAFHEMADGIKEAQRAKHAIVSMISHDLRSPLTSVLGYFSSLTSGLLGTALPDTLSGAERCERKLEHLIVLINDLLDLDRMDAGRFEIRPTLLSAELAIEKAIDVVAQSAESKGITINGVDTSAEIYADPDRIVRAIANVFSTAVRLSPTGASIQTTVVQSDGEVAIGIGASCDDVSESQLNALFDRFQQRDSELTLELPISKGIIQLHGGSIETALDQQNVTFLLHLPSAAVTKTGESS